VNGLQGTLQGHGTAQFPQGEVGLLAQQRTHLAPVIGDDHRLASGPVMAGGDIPCMAALPKEFLDHAQRNPKAPCKVLARAFPCIVSRQNSLPKIQGNGSSIAHQHPMPGSRPNGYTIY
jgi:hypothetical protein